MLAVELSRRAHRPVSLVLTRHEEQLAGGHRAAHAPDGAARRAARRDARRLRGRLRDRDGLGRLHGAAGARPGDVRVRRRERARDALPREAQPAPVERLPRPGLRRGHDRLRAGDRRARRRARARPARAAPAAARRPRPGLGQALLDQARCWPATTAPPRCPAGRSATRCARTAATASLRGLGCATQIWFGSAGPASECSIRIGADGIATVVTGIQDIGTGTLTSAQIVAAEELGLPLDRVRVVGGDTRPEVRSPAAARLGHHRERHARRARRGGQRAPRAARARRRALRDLA